MEKLLNPVPKSISTSKSGDEVIIDSVPNSDVISPYDGKVEVNGNTIRIRHKINGNYYYSDIENVGKVTSSTTYVRQGDKIGETGNGKIRYIVLDKEYKKIDSDEVFKKESSDGKNIASDEQIGKDLFNIFGLPFTAPIKLTKMLGKKAISMLEDENFEETKNGVNEEIERMKKLMK